MATPRRKNLEGWIRDAMNDDEKDGKISMMALVHMVGEQQKELHVTKFGAKKWDPKDLADMFYGKAESYCQDLPGVQTFQLMAFYGKAQPEAFQPFLVNGKTDFGGLATEGPDERGAKQQTMRHTEMLIQQVYRRQQVMDDFALRLIERQASMIENLQTENRDAFQIVKEMLMQRALDDHNRGMQRLQFERETIERKKWLSFAPPLINTILGREIFPQATADTALVEMIAESLTEEDVGKIAGVLKPELWGPLASRLGEALKKKNAEQEELKALQYRTSNPEDDAAGDATVPRLEQGK